MNKYKNYVKEFQDNNKYGLYFIDNQLPMHLKDNPEISHDIEHILDFVYSNKKIYKSLGYKTILEKANAWTKKLNTNASKKDDEVEGVDYEVVMKCKPFRFVKLLSKKAYQREGKLMSHCVASYYGESEDIYSLRDSKNLPHCTISNKSGQVKGKGNGCIHPKYIKYVMKFLEKLDVKVSDGDMENLGYVDVSHIKSVDFPSEFIYKDKWFFKSDFDKIKDKNDVNLIEMNGGQFDKDFNVVIDISKAIDKMLDSSARDYSTASALDHSTVSARDHSTVSALDHSTVSARDYNTVSARDCSTVSARDCSTVSARDHSTVSARDCSTVSARDYNTVSARDCSTVSALDHNTASALDHSTVSARDYNTVSAGMDCIISARHKSKAKGKLRTVITLCNSNSREEICEWKAFQIDGVKYKEDTWYELKNGEIMEVV